MGTTGPTNQFIHSVRLSACIIAVIFLASSCVGQLDTDSPPSPESTTEGNGESSAAPKTSEEAEEAIATSLASASPGNQLRFEILSLERHSESMLVLNMRVTNEGQEKAQTLYTLAELGGEAASPDGVSLIDTSNNKRHLPLKLTDGETCHCSNWKGEENLPPGESIEIWAAYPSPPKEVTQVSVTTPVTPDFLDIPITNASPSNKDISEAPVNDPQIIDITAFRDSTEDGNSRSESGDETTVILSSDVLFDVNESTLTLEAEESLRQVVEEIENSPGDWVKIDGYTDNTGNDSINNPLSEERASAVKARLEEILSRNDITFEVAGHGSSDPVGDNRTEEGREKNRRVTITFAK
ncbi:hypothetical protein GCM10027294_27600 [Marinactinospora endophytica]